jgi:hypothetical protein
MWKIIFDEPRKVAWLALLVGGLSAVAVGIAMTLAIS